MNAQEMIEAYLRGVGQHLPEKTRDDIQKEIRTLIEDTLEDRSREQGKPADLEMVVAVLKELGSPDKVAASYLPPRFLIGPKLFPHYLTTLKIAMPVVLVLAALGLGVSIGATAHSASGLAQGLLQGILSLVDVAFRVFGIVTIVFGVLQLTQPDLVIQEKDWDPRTLKLQPAPERIKYSEHIGEIIGGTIAIIVFNLYPQWLGLSALQNGQWIHAPVLTQAFFQYLPFYTILWALQIGLNAAILAQGKWSNLTRWLSIVLGTATIILSGVLLFGPAITAIDPAALARLGWEIPSNVPLAEAARGLETGVRIALGITMMVQVVEIAKDLYKLLLRDRVEAAGLVS